MEVDFYDKTGTPVAYIPNGDTTIYLFSGEPVAYLSGDAIYTFSGRHIGWFEDGWVRDLSGKYVFSTPGAEGGPLTVPRHPRPVKGVKRLLPIKRHKQRQADKPKKSREWSDFSNRYFSLSKSHHVIDVVMSAYLPRQER